MDSQDTNPIYPEGLAQSSTSIPTPSERKEMVWLDNGTKLTLHFRNPPDTYWQPWYDHPEVQRDTKDTTSGFNTFLHLKDLGYTLIPTEYLECNETPSIRISEFTR